MKLLLNLLIALIILLLTGCGIDPRQENAAETTTEVVAETTDEQDVVTSEAETQEEARRQALERRRLEEVQSANEPVYAPQPVPVTSANPTYTRSRNNANVALRRSERAAMLEMAKTKKLAVYCPRKMTYKKTSDVIGFVADLIDDDLIKEAMGSRLANASDGSETEVSDKDMLIRELKMYQFLELRLDDADNEGFQIKKIHDENVQQVNANMEGWHWKVTPTTSDQEQQLVLKVIVYNNDKQRLTSFDKTYKIDVKIESKRFFRNTYALFVENPEWAFATIIIPILTFLWGRYNALKRRKNDAED